MFVIDKCGNLLYMVCFSCILKITSGTKKGGHQNGSDHFFIFAVMCCITTGSKASQGLPEEKDTLTGAYLYEVPGSSQMKDMQKVLPSEIEFRKDTEGLLTVTKFTSPDEIRTAVNAFLQIRVGDRTDIFVTDQYNAISFFFPDNTTVSFQLNGRSLEWRNEGKTELYDLENAELFWEEAGLR